MDAVYPAAASALSRGRRRRTEPRLRHRTMPVTFAEIKEVDEDKEDTEEQCGASVLSVASVGGAGGAGGAGAAGDRRRRPDLLDERLARQFDEFRKRRALRPRAAALREPDDQPPPPPADEAEPRPHRDEPS